MPVIDAFALDATEHVPPALQQELREMFESIIAVKGPVYGRSVADIQNFLISCKSYDIVAAKSVVISMSILQKLAETIMAEEDTEVRDKLLPTLLQASGAIDLLGHMTDILQDLRKEHIEVAQRMCATMVVLSNQIPINEDLPTDVIDSINSGAALMWKDSVRIAQKQAEYLTGKRPDLMPEGGKENKE